MTQINTKPAYTPSAASSASEPTPAKSTPGFAQKDQYNAAAANPSGQADNPYAHVDWSKVNYDFSGVDWKSINYNVGTAAASTQKPAASASGSSQATGYSSTDSIQNSVPAQQSKSVVSNQSTSSASGASTSGSSASGPGVWLTNSSSSDQTYSFYNNASNGNGTANPTYTDPTATETLAPGQSKFVPLPADFKGRVQKTDGDANQNTWATASTWAEFQLSASNDGAAHGDISYQTGFDGAATIASTDGSNQVGGTTEDLLANAPSDILAKSATGGNAIANNSNAAATAYLQSKVDESKAYTGSAGTGTNDISSKNNQLAITFY